jgi:uncharacterized phiE125 gp8 family phage protein
MLTTVIAPVSMAVSLEDARAFCRAPEGGDDDAAVVRAVRAATEYVQDHCNLVLAPTTLRQLVDRWSSVIDLEAFPVREIVSVEYADTAGVTQTVDDALYRMELTADGARVRFLSAFQSPSLYTDQSEPIAITFEAGFDDPNASDSGAEARLKLPVRAEQVVLFLAAQFYEFREAESPVQMFPVKTVDRMLAQLRVYR